MSLREFSFKELTDENSIAFKRYASHDETRWERFVNASNNGSIFHTRRFLSYHPTHRFQDCSLIFEKKGKVISVMPAVSRRDEAGKLWLISHAGSSMGGLVFKKFTSLRDTFFVVESLLSFLQENKFDATQLTLPPLVYHSNPGNYFDFALLENGFSYLKREVSSVIPLNFSESAILDAFNAEARRAVRKGMRSGVKIVESDDYATFFAILEQNLKLRHDVQPTHTIDEMRQLVNLFPDEIKLFSAEIDEEMIAGVVLFECNAKVGLAFYISHREDRQKYRGVNLLFYEVIRYCLQRKLQYLDFGIFTVNMKPNWGLARFKESFGALGVFRDTLVKSSL